MTDGTYDVVAVLCGGLRHNEKAYEPTTFSDSDEFGMLGGYVRVLAAIEIWLEGKSKNFLFSTGVSAKQIEKFGPEVPPEAVVYRDAFLREISESPILSERKKSLTTFVEDKSVNTVGNLEGIIQICIDNNWQKVAILSSDYHIPRIRALLSLLAERLGVTIEFTFLLAESILKEAHPDTYTVEFDKAYESQEGQKRIANEKKGQEAIEEGLYVFTEFQLVRRN